MFVLSIDLLTCSSTIVVYFAMALICLICDQQVEVDRSNVREKGMQGLLNASIIRNDGKHNLFKGKVSGVVHSSCRKSYIRTNPILEFLEKLSLPENQPIDCEDSTTQFSFHTNCIFCCETIDTEFCEKQKKRPLCSRQTFRTVSSASTKENIEKCATKRGDKWGEEVLTRINMVNDLARANAVYHVKCYNTFLTTKRTAQKRGRPEGEYVLKAMEEIYNHLEENEDCQYSLEELMNVISGEKPTYKTIKAKLFEKYGERVVITQLHSRKNIICFRDVGNKILSDSWYGSKCNDEEGEKLRIVRTAAAIIKKDIQSQIYETDKYPASDKFLDEAQDMVPTTLSVLIQSLFCSRSGNEEKTKRKEISVSHAIIHAVRPRSFISPVLHGLAFFIHRKYAAKNLINLLANLGFSASYNDAQVLELSAIYHPAQAKPSGIFSQFVFDNADYDVSTLDGKKTFHSMGGVECIVPAERIPPAEPIQKLLVSPSDKSIESLGVLPLETYENVGNMGLKALEIENLLDRYPISDFPFPKVLDVLWFVGQRLGLQGIPEWKGYIRGLHGRDSELEKSAVLPLPFINAPPSDYSTIYTALRYAAKLCHEQGMKTCYVTFDQPLYIKGREIVASCQNDPLLKSVVVRLGGFHLLMSFLGCVGYTMAGSGLKEVLTTVFAANSVEKILTGHAFSRAVRGHILVQSALAEIVLNRIDLSEGERDETTKLLTQLKNDDKVTQIDINENPVLVKLQEKMKNELENLNENGPTSALWVRYFHMISIMKQFIEAERSGNWELHLTTVQQMIPFFHSSGHLQYAKCAHLYVQDMRTLHLTHPFHLHEFTDKSYFTVARSNNPGSGNWTDMTIEQVLMRSMKTHGGLTSGRGITDSVLAKWIGGAAVSISICTALEEFASVQFLTAEQHVDFRPSRQKRNKEDRKCIFDWFTHHQPFPQQTSLVSIATGVVGNSKVNCHEALEIGKLLMAKMTGQSFGEVKQSRKDKVLSLAAMGSTIVVNNVVEVVNPLIIYQRMAILKKSDSDLQNLLNYELAPFPLSLFDECGMRKTKKSALYDVFPVHLGVVDLEATDNVIDGGFLLHRVKWSGDSTFSSIFNQYVMYIKKHFGLKCTVVFDGYTDTENSTKRTEQKRRGIYKTSVDIEFNENMKVNVQQEHFLCNERNKTKFIGLLCQKLEQENVKTKTAKGDADTTIIQCGISNASAGNKVAIIGEDIDLLVLLTALAPPQTDITFVKPGRGKVETKIFSSLELQKITFSPSILFIHAFSGCDTTSSIFRKGKLMVPKLFQKDQSLTTISEVFYDHTSTHENVSHAGEKMFLRMYSGRQRDLNSQRYESFVKSATQIKPELATLPPTRGSAEQHSYRVFLQVQMWLGNQMSPEEWGWTRGVDGILIPVTTNDAPAPDFIMRSIFCNCTTGCGVRCGCRKSGMPCTTICGNCEGRCTNGPLLEDKESHEQSDDV